MKNFYNHLIEIDTLVIELESLSLSDKEKKDLASLIDATMHHQIMDAVLSHLSQEDKMNFIYSLKMGDKGLIWEFLNSKVDQLEEKIKLAGEQVKMKLKEDIKEARLKHKERYNA